MELFLEVYQAFVTAFRETGGVPEGRYMTGKIRDYLSDYFREETLRRLRALTGQGGESAPAPFFFPAPGEEEKEAEKEAEIKAEALSESFLESLRLKGFKGEGSGVCGLRAGSKMLFSLASCALSSRGIRALPYTGSWSLFGLRADLGPRAFFRADPRFFADHSEDLGLFLDESLRTRILQALESALSEAEEDLSSFAGWVFWEEEGKDRGLPMDPMAVRMGRHQKKLLSALLEREEEMIRERGLFLTEEDVFRMPL